MKSDERILYLSGEAGERALVARSAAGEDAAYLECYKSYAPSIMRILLRLLRNPALVEKILQETFIAVFRTIGKFRGEARIAFNRSQTR